MRTLTLVFLALATAGNAVAQRRARIGPTVSSISIEDGSGGSQSFTSFGGSLAFLSGDDGEIGVGVSRYGDLSSSSCVRQMTFVGLESNYYPIGAKGVAPFASSAVGLARMKASTLGKFYAHLRAEGKPAKVALTAVMRKLLLQMNRVLKEHALQAQAKPQMQPA